MAKEKGGKAENFFVLDTKEATYKKGKGTKGAINIADLKSSVFDLENAINIVARNTAPIEKTKISKYSELSVDEQVNKAVDALITCLSSEKKIIAGYKEEIQEIKKTIKKWNQEGNNIKGLKKSAVKALESGNKEVAIKKLNKLEKNGNTKLVTKLLEKTGYKAVYKSNAKNVFVIYSLKKIKSTKKKGTTPEKPSATTNTQSTTQKVTASKTKTVAKATNSTVVKKTSSKTSTVASLKKALKKALKKGGASAVSAYTLLASAIGKKKAKAYANKLGYNVKYKNNQAVSLTKIKEEKSLLNVEKSNNKDKNTTDSNTTTTDKNDNRKPSAIINGDDNADTNPNDNLNNNQDNPNDVVASVDVENNNTNNTPAPPDNPTNDGNNNSSSNDTKIVNSSQNSNSVNSNPEITEDGNTSNIPADDFDNDIPADLEDDFEEPPKKENKVTTIDTDTEVEETKKSGGLGAAIPLGLGAIGTGAAAVAGVRYLKNRNNSEDYDDSEDYDEDSQYIDSAQYATEDDEYSGPAGSVYTDVSESSVDDLYTDSVEESYIDPEDFEEDGEDDFSNDKAFEEINSNFN